MLGATAYDDEREIRWLTVKRFLRRHKMKHVVSTPTRKMTPMTMPTLAPLDKSSPYGLRSPAVAPAH